MTTDATENQDAGRRAGSALSEGLGPDPERAAFESFVAEWTGRDMRHHEAAGTWGLGLDSFAWACWQRAKAAERKRWRVACETIAGDLRNHDMVRLGAAKCMDAGLKA